MSGFIVPRVGERFDGRYELKSHLRGGGPAQVFLAVDGSGRQVSLVLLDPACCGPEAWAAFFRVVGMAAASDVPGLVPLRAVGVTPPSRPFCFADAPAGRGFDRLRQEAGVSSWQHALKLGERVAEILQASFTATGAPHRALIASRCTVISEEEIKVLDYGIGELEPAAGRPDDVGYRAPEQLSNRGDERSDVYSLAAILFELISGERPSVKLPPRLRSLVPGLPQAVDELFARALARDPTRRYSDAGALRAGIRELLKLGPVVSPSRVNSAGSSPVTPAGPSVGSPVALGPELPGPSKASGLSGGLTEPAPVGDTRRDDIATKTNPSRAADNRLGPGRSVDAQVVTMAPQPAALAPLPPTPVARVPVESMASTSAAAGRSEELRPVPRPSRSRDGQTDHVIPVFPPASSSGDRTELLGRPLRSLPADADRTEVLPPAQNIRRPVDTTLALTTELAREPPTERLLVPASAGSSGLASRASKSPAVEMLDPPTQPFMQPTRRPSIPSVEDGKTEVHRRPSLDVTEKTAVSRTAEPVERTEVLAPRIPNPPVDTTLVLPGAGADAPLVVDGAPQDDITIAVSRPVLAPEQEPVSSLPRVAAPASAEPWSLKKLLIVVNLGLLFLVLLGLLVQRAL